VEPTPLFARSTLTVRPWPDQVIDALGHDPRSVYVETFWLGVLGPSVTWLLRRLATGLDATPSGFELSLADTARELGLGDRAGRHSPLVRTLARCCQFDVARAEGADVLAVRRKLPPLTRRQLHRLPRPLQERHRQWLEGLPRAPVIEQLRHRARHLALSLFELGEDVDATERQLLRWRFHPSLCREATTWAWERHQTTRAAPAPPTSPPVPAAVSGAGGEPGRGT
jgi:hypothetical protein